MSAQDFFFADPALAARYVDGPPRFVPGHQDMLRMAAMLLTEDAPAAAKVLVLGAGGGIELRHFASAHASWHFTGVDPSAQMLAAARNTLGEMASRCELIEGTIDAAPDGPFDAASCLLTLHMIPDDGSKLATLQAIRSRLHPGAPFVIVDHCLDRRDPQFDRKLDHRASGRPVSATRATGSPSTRESHRWTCRIRNMSVVKCYNITYQPAIPGSDGACRTS